MSSNSETFIIKFRDQGVEKGLDTVDHKADRARGKVSALNGAFRVFGTILAGISIAELGGQVIDTLAKFERFDAVLTNTLGSKSAAKIAMDELVEFASTTPFEVDSLTDSFVKLANQGFRPTMEQMTALGDIAASKGKDMQQLAEAVIDAEVGEFERLKEFGIRASKSGDQVKFTFKGVETQVQNTSDQIRNYIIGLGQAEGVSGSMAAISATTGGQISNLKDTITQLYLEIGQYLKPEIGALISGFKDTVEWARQVINWLQSGSASAEAFKIGVVALAGAVGIYVTIMQAAALWTRIVTAAQWLWNAALTANPIGLVIAAVGALIAVISYLSKRFTGWGEAWKHTVAGAKLTFMAYVASVKASWNALIDGFMIGLNRIKKGWYEFKNAVGIGDKAENLSIIQRIDQDTQRRKQEIVDGFKESGKLGMAALNEFKLAAASIKKKTDEEIKAEDQESFVNSKGTSGSLAGGLGGSSAGAGPSAGIAEVKASAPKTFNINVEALIKENNINTTNLKEGALQLETMLKKLLLTVVNDTQIIASR